MQSLEVMIMGFWGGLIDFIQYLPGHELKINSHFNHACTQCTELMQALTFE